MQLPAYSCAARAALMSQPVDTPAAEPADEELDAFNRELRELKDALLTSPRPTPKPPTSPPPPRGLEAGAYSSTSQLNLSQFWSLKPQPASTSQLKVSRFCDIHTRPTPQKVLTTN